MMEAMSASFAVGELIQNDPVNFSVDEPNTYDNINLPDGYTKPSKEAYDEAFSRYLNIELFKELREERNTRLAEVDWVFSTDYQIPDDKRVVWIAYRRALRELPSTTEDPTNPVWPEKPMMPTGETSASTVETDLQSEKSKVVLLQNVVFNLSKRIQALESA
jgi:hypothetical protein|tara:strand:- start:726 stop:1211 length:486 start_codon:yes stop_codon:yes gene_type:complete